MTSYAEECRLRAKYLLEAADGVEFQFKYVSGWDDIENPTFSADLSLYRRKPKTVRHERVVVQALHDDGDAEVYAFRSDSAINEWFVAHRSLKELKRETVFVEVVE